MTTLQELACEARRINAGNGWGLDFAPDQNRDEVPCYLALIHSEITEAWQAGTQAETVRELGDVVVRCVDLCELLRPGALRDLEELHVGVDEARPSGSLLSFNCAAELMHLHAIASEALELYRKETDWKPGVLKKLQWLAFRTWGLMLTLGGEPEAVIHDILNKNSQRGYRHGGRRT